jgi:hypothetical protein
VKKWRATPKKWRATPKKWRATPKKLHSYQAPLFHLWWRHMAHARQGRANRNDIDRPPNFDISWSRLYEYRLTHAESLAGCSLVTVQGQNECGLVPIIGCVVVCGVQIGRAPSLSFTCCRGLCNWGWSGGVVRFPVSTAWVKNFWSTASTIHLAILNYFQMLLMKLFALCC